MSSLCPNCGGRVAIRNPTGACDHLYWPDMLTEEAKQMIGPEELARIQQECMAAISDALSRPRQTPTRGESK